MNFRQQLFVKEYVRDFNATQAAIRAGYSERTAYSIGQENLTKDYIAEAIQRQVNTLGVSIPEDVAKKRISKLANWIYLIREDFAGLIKIGIAGAPLRRLVGLQISCPQTLTLVDAVSITNAYEYEIELHARFSDKHVRGEWFRLLDTDLVSLREEWEELRRSAELG